MFTVCNVKRSNQFRTTYVTCNFVLNRYLNLKEKYLVKQMFYFTMNVKICAELLPLTVYLFLGHTIYLKKCLKILKGACLIITGGIGLDAHPYQTFIGNMYRRTEHRGLCSLSEEAISFHKIKSKLQNFFKCGHNTV